MHSKLIFFFSFTFLLFQGVIFSIHYHQRQQLMCSVSDDRSIRVWKLTFQGKNAPESILPEDWATATSEVVHVLYGHSARVWRARLLTTGIISIGEVCCFVSLYSAVLKAKVYNSVWLIKTWFQDAGPHLHGIRTPRSVMKAVKQTFKSIATLKTNYEYIYVCVFQKFNKIT